MSMDSFTCPICFKTELKTESMKLMNCNHYLCWTCCGKQMRFSGQVAIKCPQCRSQETMAQIRRRGNAADEDDEDDLDDDDEDDLDDDENDEDYNEGYADQGQDELSHKTTFINGTFNIRFSHCRFNSANPYGH